MKKIFLTLAMFIVIFSTNVLAADDSLLIDEAALLSEADNVLISNGLTALKGEHDFYLHIITLDSYDGDSLLDYADNFRGDESFNGLVFVFNTDELNREYAVSTAGDGMYIFDDFELDLIDVSVIPLLTTGEYFEAFDTLISIVDDAIIEWDNDDYYEDMYAENDYDLDPEPSQVPSIIEDYAVSFFVALILAVIIAMSVISSMKSKMNTARKKTVATNYLNSDSLNLRVSNDRFLYENTTRTKKSQSSSGGSSGGSRSVGGSRRTNSSGRSRGGRSRKF